MRLYTLYQKMKLIKIIIIPNIHYTIYTLYIQTNRQCYSTIIHNYFSDLSSRQYCSEKMNSQFWTHSIGNKSLSTCLTVIGSVVTSVGDPNDFFRIRIWIRILVFRPIRIRIRLFRIRIRIRIGSDSDSDLSQN